MHYENSSNSLDFMLITGNKITYQLYEYFFIFVTYRAGLHHQGFTLHVSDNPNNC